MKSNLSRRTFLQSVPVISAVPLLGRSTEKRTFEIYDWELLPGEMPVIGMPEMPRIWHFREGTWELSSERRVCVWLHDVPNNSENWLHKCLQTYPGEKTKLFLVSRFDEIFGLAEYLDEMNPFNHEGRMVHV